MPARRISESGACLIGDRPAPARLPPGTGRVSPPSHPSHLSLVEFDQVELYMDTLIQPQTNPSRPPSRQPARRRRRGRGWVLFFLFLAVLAVFTAAGYVYLDQLALERVPVDTLSAAEGTTNYLIVGSDSREDLPDDLEGNFGDFSGARSDVIILAHVTDGRRQLLSLPRDLKVDIPGEGTNR